MNIKTKKSILVLYTVLAFVLGVIFAVWRTVLLKQNYDPYDGTFELGSGDILQTCEYFLIFAVLLMLTALFFMKGISFKRFGERYSTASLSVFIICGIVTITATVLSVIDMLFGTRSNSFVTKLFTVLSFITVIFVIAYFFMSALPQYSNNRIKLVFSLIIPVFILCYLVASYFNTDFVYNDFNRISCHISLLSILFFSLSEASLSLGRKAHIFNFMTTLICFVCIPAYIIPLIALAAFWEVQFTAILLFEIFQIAFLIYATASALSAVKTICEA